MASVHVKFFIQLSGFTLYIRHCEGGTAKQGTARQCGFKYEIWMERVSMISQHERSVSDPEPIRTRNFRGDVSVRSARSAQPVRAHQSEFACWDFRSGDYQRMEAATCTSYPEHAWRRGVAECFQKACVSAGARAAGAQRAARTDDGPSVVPPNPVLGLPFSHSSFTGSALTPYIPLFPPVPALAEFGKGSQ